MATLPLLALRAFAETGRHASVKRAAVVLGVTPGAVSQQIKLLEQRLSITLFVRIKGRLKLSEAGARVHPMLIGAFDQMEKALSVLTWRNGRTSLRVSTAPAFAASWLVPRLGRFTEAHPDIDVRIDATPALADLSAGEVDLAIRHGLGDYPGYAVQRLFTPVRIPVMAPHLTSSPLRTPADCLSYPLLQDSERNDWLQWLRANNVPDDARAARGPSFPDDYLLIRAAVSGQGIALVRDFYAAEEIAAGRLNVALDCPWPTRFAYYLVARPEIYKRPHVAAFIDWINAEFATIRS